MDRMSSHQGWLARQSISRKLGAQWEDIRVYILPLHAALWTLKSTPLCTFPCWRHPSFRTWSRPLPVISDDWDVKFLIIAYILALSDAGPDPAAWCRYIGHAEEIAGSMGELNPGRENLPWKTNDLIQMTSSWIAHPGKVSDSKGI